MYLETHLPLEFRTIITEEEKGTGFRSFRGMPYLIQEGFFFCFGDYL